MSSLLQFSGRTGRRGVELQFYKSLPHGFYLDHFTGEYRNGQPVYEGKDYHEYSEGTGPAAEEVTCLTCGKQHPRLYVAWRKPVGMFGCWVVFRYNGEEHVPDLSVPISLYKLPRDAKPLSDSDNAKYWHS